MLQLTGEPARRLLADAVAEFSRATGFPLAFGGYESAGTTAVTSAVGNRTEYLTQLRVRTERGLGGRAVSERRPRVTGDYRRCRHITHDYDAPILGEGIQALFAMPVVVDGEARAILYGGSRERSPRAAFVEAGAAVARELAREIRIEDEVERRIAARSDTMFDGVRLEDLRLGHAELRRITADVTDAGLRARLAALEARFAGGPREAATGTATAPVSLSPREVDVLAEAALGSTNIAIGRLLGLTESTVKSYLRAAMSKLEAPTRHAAVVAARRIGILP